MFLIRALVKQSSIHGLGCFAMEDIAKGAVIWKLDPLIDIQIDVRTLDSLPAPFREFLGIYGYVPYIDGGHTLILCGDHARHMNHSDDPNVIECAGDLNIAARDIKAGDELTCDYRAFDTDAALKLSEG